MSIYVYSHFFPVQFHSLAGKPLAWPVDVKPRTPYPIGRRTVHYQDYNGTMMKREYTEQEVTDNLLITHEADQMGLVQLQGSEPTAKEIARSRAKGLAHAAQSLKTWYANYEFATKKGGSGPVPSEHIMMSAEVLEANAKGAFKALRLPREIVSLVQTMLGETDFAAVLDLDENEEAPVKPLLGKTESVDLTLQLENSV